jgi:hypothetical protein
MVPLRSKRLLRFVSIWLANLFFLSVSSFAIRVTISEEGVIQTP